VHQQIKVIGTLDRLTAHWILPTRMADGRRGIIGVMTDVTQILSLIESGDPSAAEQLLPLVYEELRKLAAAKLCHEKSGQTLQATAFEYNSRHGSAAIPRARDFFAKNGRFLSSPT
jgi:ECF sigma factor